MKRASYRDAIEWVAYNDSPGDDDALDPNTVQNLVSAVLVADIFDVPKEKVGRDIVKRRHWVLPPVESGPVTKARDAVFEVMRSKLKR